MCKGKGKVEFKICMFPMETVYQIKLNQIMRERKSVQFRMFGSVSTFPFIVDNFSEYACTNCILMLNILVVSFLMGKNQRSLTPKPSLVLTLFF